MGQNRISSPSHTSPKSSTHKTSKMVHALPMKNKKYFVVLLAGGPRDIAREVRARLADCRNIYVKYHWEYESERQWQKPIPKDVDFVIGLKDMMGHSKFDLMKKAGKKADVRWIITQRKWAIMAAALHNHGIKAADPLPIEFTSTMVFAEDLEPASTPAPAETPPPPAELPKEPVIVPVEEPKPLANSGVDGRLWMPTDSVYDKSQVDVPVPVPQVAAAQQPIVLPLPRLGAPSPETMVLISALYQRAQDDGINIMITPTSLNIESAARVAA
jgi:hypothetical protein